MDLIKQFELSDGRVVTCWLVALPNPFQHREGMWRNYIENPTKSYCRVRVMVRVMG